MTAGQFVLNPTSALGVIRSGCSKTREPPFDIGTGFDSLYSYPASAL
jgi:hypothetical protein